MRLHRFAVVTASLTYVLLIVGALVHGTGSSLACPDWPLCHGSLFPRMTNGVEFEHSHRLVAGTVAILTAVLAVLLVRDSRYRSLRSLAVAAPIMVLAQAILGGITVLFRLPLMVTMAHLTLSMCFFSVLIVLAIRTKTTLAPPSTGASVARQRPFASIVTGAVLLQIVLGGLVRHTMSGLACTTFPFCFGQVWPRESSSEQMHMLHRFGAVIVAALVIALAFRVLRHSDASPELRTVRRLAKALPWLVLLQITLGVFSVTSLLHLPTVTTHLAVGALLLGTLVSLWTLLGAAQASGASDRVRAGEGDDALAPAGMAHEGSA